MRSRILVGSLLIVAAVVFGASRLTATPAAKWAAVNLVDTTLIAGKFVSGPVLFVHDDVRMARGEPCTTVYRYDEARGAGEQLVAFYCKPHWGKTASSFTRSQTNRPDGPAVMTEYQFAGDEEVHGIPIR